MQSNGRQEQRRRFFLPTHLGGKQVLDCKGGHTYIPVAISFFDQRGVSYRLSKNIDDRDPEGRQLRWGESITAVGDTDGWIEVDVAEQACCSRSDQTVLLSESKRKLILHFDVNETILVGDPISGINFDASLNNVIAKAAIVKRDSSDNCVWHDGSELDPAKRKKDAKAPALSTQFSWPVGCNSYFHEFRKDPKWPPQKFTEAGSPGEMYRHIYEKMMSELKWKHPPHECLAPAGYTFLVPSFYHTLSELTRQGRDFSVIFRTFGSDLPNIAKAVRAFAEGLHPDFRDQNFKRFYLEDKDALFALHREDRSNLQSPISLHRVEKDFPGYPTLSETNSSVKSFEVVASEAATIDKLLQSNVLGIRDDYYFWRDHKYTPEGGKPLWLNVYDTSVHQIFFDDNINNLVDDSIVAVRSRSSKDSPFRALSGEKTRALEGTCLVKAQMVDAALDRNYFLKCIKRCEDNWDKMDRSSLLR